jgi:hypothetical protein
MWSMHGASIADVPIASLFTGSPQIWQVQSSLANTNQRRAGSTRAPTSRALRRPFSSNLEHRVEQYARLLGNQLMLCFPHRGHCPAVHVRPCVPVAAKLRRCIALERRSMARRRWSGVGGPWSGGLRNHAAQLCEQYLLRGTIGCPHGHVAERCRDGAFDAARAALYLSLARYLALACL